MLVQYLKGPLRGQKRDPGTARAIAAVRAGVAKPVGWELPPAQETLAERRARTQDERKVAAQAAAPEETETAPEASSEPAEEGPEQKAASRPRKRKK